MKLLNIGCGSVRPRGKEWINIDDLYKTFHKGRVERAQLDSEPNYLDCDVKKGLPFEDNSADGIVANNIIEHFDAQEALVFFRECYRVLKTGGVLRIGVPCPVIFYNKTIAGDDNWGEPNVEAHLGKSFMEYALFFKEHKQLVSEDILKCYYWLAKFKEYTKQSYKESYISSLGDVDNRSVYSIFYEGIK